MTNADGRAVCARCGAALPASADACAVCNGAVARSVLAIATVGPFDSGARGASALRRALALAASIVLPVLLGAGVAAAVWQHGVAPAALLGGLLALLLLLAQAMVWMRTGRAVGNLLTATRSVRSDDGTAPGIRLFRARPYAASTVTGSRGPLGRLLGTVTVVIGAQGDPLALSDRGPASLPTRLPGAAARDALRRPITLVFDERMRIPLVRSVILGRNPPPAGGDVLSVAVPDLSRSISKSHVRLDNERGRVFVQDLGSTNGTELVTDAGVQVLRSGERVEVPPGARLVLAGSPLRLDTGHASAAA